MRMSEVISSYSPKLFLDMDGVLADFNSSFANFNYDINRLASSDPRIIFSVYSNLNPLNEGMNLVQWLKSHKIPFTLLSAPLRSINKNDTSGSEASKLGKIEWIKKYLPGMENSVQFTSSKSKFAGNGNILIDDREVFLNPWKAAGGHGILYRGYSSTVSELEKLLFSDDKELSENKQQESQEDRQRQSMFINFLELLSQKSEIDYKSQMWLRRMLSGISPHCGANRDIVKLLKTLSMKSVSPGTSNSMNMWIEKAAISKDKTQTTNSFKFKGSKFNQSPTLGDR